MALLEMLDCQKDNLSRDQSVIKFSAEEEREKSHIL